MLLILLPVSINLLIIFLIIRNLVENVNEDDILKLLRGGKKPEIEEKVIPIIKLVVD